MANSEQLEIIRQGAKVWNDWIKTIHKIDHERAKEVGIVPGSIALIDFAATVTLHDADLGGIDLSGADLSFVGLSRAKFFEANLSHAVLSGSDLSGADFRFANLRGANLRYANLISATFSRATLDGADFSNAHIGMTSFGNNDLSFIKGLDTLRHHMPSSIDIGTIVNSSGNIPDTFLQGVGIPETFITYMRSLTMRAIEFYSCFISYSSNNQAFAERLHRDLQNQGIRCWFAPEDLKIGDNIRLRIDESIRLHDKLLLVLSEDSVKSQWVEQEVETALAKEREEGRTVLFPIRLDDTVMNINYGWPALIKNTRHIGDFRNWEEHGKYDKAFERLWLDLQAKDPTPSRA